MIVAVLVGVVGGGGIVGVLSYIDTRELKAESLWLNNKLKRLEFTERASALHTKLQAELAKAEMKAKDAKRASLQQGIIKELNQRLRALEKLESEFNRIGSKRRPSYGPIGRIQMPRDLEGENRALTELMSRLSELEWD